MQHPGAVAQPAVGHRHVAGAALVAAHDDADRVLVGQRTGQPDIALAGHAEDLIDVVRFQAFRQQAGNGTGHVGDVSWMIVSAPEQRTSG